MSIWLVLLIGIFVVLVILSVVSQYLSRGDERSDWMYQFTSNLLGGGYDESDSSDFDLVDFSDCDSAADSASSTGAGTSGGDF